MRRYSFLAAPLGATALPRSANNIVMGCSFTFFLSSSAATTSTTTSSNHQQRQKPQWGDWAGSSSASSSSTSAGGDEETRADRVNYYDAKAFMGQHKRATVICRQKPVVKSWSERAIEYLRPKSNIEGSWIDSLQLMKIFGYLAVPVLLLIGWKSKYEEYPDHWERMAAQVEARPPSDSAERDGKTKRGASYFEVIEGMESRREAAMVRKGYSANDLSK